MECLFHEMQASATLHAFVCRLKNMMTLVFSEIVVVVWRGISSKTDGRTKAESLSFYHPGHQTAWDRLHWYISDIKFVAIHCMLTISRSPLNIFRSSRKCECGKTKNLKHVLLHCPLYEKLRIPMLDELKSILANSDDKLSLDVH